MKRAVCCAATLVQAVPLRNWPGGEDNLYSRVCLVLGLLDWDGSTSCASMDWSLWVAQPAAGLPQPRTPDSGGKADGLSAPGVHAPHNAEVPGASAIQLAMSRSRHLQPSGGIGRKSTVLGSARRCPGST